MKPYFETKNGVLYHGDCLDIMPILNTTIDMVLCDPPYGTTACKWDSIIPLEKMWREISNVTNKKTPILLMSQTPFDKVLGCSNLEKLRYEWIWEKTTATGHLNAKKMPMKSHENILVFYDVLPTYNAQKTKCHKRKISTSENKRNCKKTELWGEYNLTSYDSTERYPRSVQLFSTDRQTSSLHPTQKPVDLFSYLISTYTNPEDTVLDFCIGSGTTAVACEQLSRKWIGIEREEQYCEIAANRLSEPRQKSLLI